jgi:hypothetical protein
VLSRKLEIGLLALLVAAAGAYAIGLFTGLVTVVGYEAKTEAQVGASRTTRGALEFGIPVWLGERHAIRADFDIDARFGAVILRVIGDSKCPTYDVTYRVTWRIAGDQDLSRGLRV